MKNMNMYISDDVKLTILSFCGSLKDKWNTIYFHPAEEFMIDDNDPSILLTEKLIMMKHVILLEILLLNVGKL